MQRIVKQDRSKAGGRIHLHPPRAVIGLEAEFSLIINGVRERPEKIFGTAQKLIRRKMLPRTGRSFQLPSGGAIYFDTGVIEVATPIVELEAGLFAIARHGSCGNKSTTWARSCGVGRGEINAGAAPGFQHALHFSFETKHASAVRDAKRLGYLLAHILPGPVMLLAANRKSTAVGFAHAEEKSK